MLAIDSSRALMKKTKSKVLFNFKKWRVLVQNLEEIDYSNVVEAAIEQLQSGLHLELSEPRSHFVRTICDHEKPVRKKVVACIMSMILTFIDLYTTCMIGKRYASFQRSGWKTSLVREEVPEPQENVAAPCTSTDKQE